MWWWGQVSTENIRLAEHNKKGRPSRDAKVIERGRNVSKRHTKDKNVRKESVSPTISPKLKR
jgi:hypothetical protein